MYRHIFLTDIYCLIFLIAIGGAEMSAWLIFGKVIAIIAFVITAIMLLVQVFATIYDIIDYHNYKEIEKIEKEITYLIKRAMDAEGDF